MGDALGIVNGGAEIGEEKGAKQGVAQVVPAHLRLKKYKKEN